MADAGDLERLPLEIRKEIYECVLAEAKTIAIKRYINPHDRRRGEIARVDNHRKSTNRGKIWNGRKKTWYDAPPSSTSILVVNKTVNREATPAFYSSNDFAFENSHALQDFLTWIGDSRQHLRKIAILDHGAMFQNSWKSMDRSLALLTAAKGFRAFAFSHSEFCGQSTAVRYLDPKTLAKHFVPFLKSLHEAHSTLGLSVNILDVVKIILPPCHCDFCGNIFKKGQRVECCRTPGEPHKEFPERMVPARMDFSPAAVTRRCNCLCENAEDTNRRFARDMREVFAGGLGLDMNDESYAKKM